MLQYSTIRIIYQLSYTYCFSYISAADGSYLQTAQYVQDTQNYVRNNVMHKSTGGHSTDDSYVRTDEEDAELYDHDPKVRIFLL